MSTSEVTEAVLAVLAGADVAAVAATIGMRPAELADASEVYREAGWAALASARSSTDWFQVHIEFADWARAESLASSRLGPALARAEASGMLADWWFIRKAPCWRVRCQPGPAATFVEMTATVGELLDRIVAAGGISRWWETFYEPEIFAFGGRAGMAVAHQLFHADSRAVLDHLASGPVVARRQLTVLLCTAMLRAAGQDWHEQGDIWHRVAQLRPEPAAADASRARTVGPQMLRLLTADLASDSALFAVPSPLAFAVPWTAAFAAAGRDLAAIAVRGDLQRGLRDVLAHHVIFHWNRLGVPDRAQSVLARLARDVMMTTPDRQVP